MSVINGLRQQYWKLNSLLSPAKQGGYASDYTPQEIEILDTVRPRTMTTNERVVSLVRAVDHLCQHRIEGDIVECGVWKGGSMMAAALALKKNKDLGRQLHLYDTYDGMPPPTDNDRDHLGVSAADQLAIQDKDAQVWARAQIEEVEANMRLTGYPWERVHLIKGLVEETIPAHMPERIALLRLDTDWYESTRHELIHLYPRLVPGGVLILDDYGHWQGARKAVDEYLADHGIPLLLCRIDMGGRIAVKPN